MLEIVSKTLVLEGPFSINTNPINNNINIVFYLEGDMRNDVNMAFSMPIVKAIAKEIEVNQTNLNPFQLSLKTGLELRNFKKMSIVFE